MSVAFRRESDEEHLEPKFEIPIPVGPNLVTRTGLAQIMAKAAELRAELPMLADESRIAAVKRDLRYWNTRQSTAQLMPDPDGEQVAFGVSVTFLLKGRQRTIRIVGDDEADPGSGFVSFSAPLSRALMGAEAGETLPYQGEDDAIEVVAIAVDTPA